MRQRLSGFAQYVAIVGAALVLAALGGRLVNGYLKPWMEWTGAAGVVLLASAALLRPDAVRAALGARQTRYGGNAAVMSLAMVGIVMLTNYLGARHSQRWDVTAEKQFSLSEQTLQILGSLQEPVSVKAFFTPSHYNIGQAVDMLKEYAARSNKITYEVIDPEAQRLLTLDYQVSRDGTIIFERGDRREVTFGVQEQDLTSALLKVSKDGVNRVYFATGHQERDPQSTDVNGYDTIRQVLESENYQVSQWNAATGQPVPQDAAVLVISGPQSEYAPQELDALRAYVDQGGRLLVMVEAGHADPLGGFLQPYGLVLNDDVVIDPAQAFFGDLVTPLVGSYTFHQITKDLSGASTIFPTVRALTLADPAPQGWLVTVLAQSSADAWAEVAYREAQVQHDATEAAGPLALVAAVEPQGEPAGRGRLVVIGDSDLVANNIVNSVRGVANVDLFMNAVGWLAEEDELISIRPKQYEAREVTLTSPQTRAVVYGNIIAVPLAVLAAGALVWWRRR